MTVTAERYPSLPAETHHARVTPADPRHGGPLLRLVARISRRRYGRVPSPVLVTARSRWALRGMVAYEMAIDRARALDVKLEDMAVLRAAEVVNCEYCRDIGRAILLQRGVAAERVEAAARGEMSALSELEQLILRYAEAMSSTPIAVDDDLVAALRRHLDDEQVVELTSAIAWENFRARFNAALGIAPQGFAAACAL
jgi:AhpD family alkylhydroperoxidase